MLMLGAGGLAALVAGMWLLPPGIAIDAPATADAIFALLPVTLPAALLVIVASLTNIGIAGLLVQRLLPSGERSLVAVVLAAYGGAVLLDVALLYTLGGLRLFTWPVLIAVHLGLLAVVWVTRHPLRRPVLTPFQPHLGWALVAAVWSAPILLQLASPVVPFMDVLPNLVAPVEHLRTFGQFDPLTTSPSPIYGASRLSIGYVGLLGAITTLSGLPAAQAISAFIAVEVAFVAVAVVAIARSAAGRHAVFWALIAFAMTQPFARLADDRSRIVAIPILAWTVIEVLRAARHDSAPRRTAWTIGLGLGATLLMHAVMGAFLALVLLALVAVQPARHRSVMPGLAMAAILALPQAGVMVGIRVPTLLAILAVPVAAGVCLAVDRIASIRLAGLRAARVTLGLGIGTLIVAADAVVPALVRWFSDFGPLVPFLGLTGLAGLGWVRSSARPLLIAMLAVGVLAGTAAHLVPTETDSLVWQSVRYEIPKEVHTWLPIALAIGAAALLAGLARRIHPAEWLRPGWRLGAVAAWLVIAAVPLRLEPIGPLHVGERHLAENLAIQLRYAADGFWTGYPDSRWVIDDAQRQVLAVIRREIADGRITAATRLLHVARTYQQWEAIPVGVFSGVIETVVSPDSTETIHTVGGRLVPFDRLSAELANDYDYLLVEWRGLPPEVAQMIGGFEPIFTGEQAQLLRRRSADT